ncbi:MAG: GTP cyclohydrolase II [Microbacteriaceae bacterium]|nr:GTP cyclohydrolase II [Microbacteriaceae bacterium]
MTASDSSPAAAHDASGATGETPRIRFEVETAVPTEHGEFRVRGYTDTVTGIVHLAICAGEPSDGMRVRIHSECLTGEAFGSMKCECGPQLEAALNIVQAEGGAVLYLRGHEGRGIGLLNKLRAYRLQEDGLDTVDANLALGLPADAREYIAAAGMLDDLGVGRVRLLTNNPLKQAALEEHGIEVIERVPLEVGRNAVNDEYLKVKAERMGHLFG